MARSRLEVKCSGCGSIMVVEGHVLWMDRLFWLVKAHLTFALSLLTTPSLLHCLKNG